MEYSTPNQQGNNKNRGLKIASIVFLFLLPVLSYWYFGKQTAPLRIAWKYFEYPESLPIIQSEGATIEKEFRRANGHYQKQDFTWAVIALNNTIRTPQTQHVIAYNLGLCHFISGDAAAAVKDFELVLNYPENPLKEKAKWNLALSHLHNKNQTAAKQLLLDIQNNHPIYKDKAKRLLAELE